jgi:hypothetical protein
VGAGLEDVGVFHGFTPRETSTHADEGGLPTDPDLCDRLVLVHINGPVEKRDYRSIHSKILKWEAFGDLFVKPGCDGCHLSGVISVTVQAVARSVTWITVALPRIGYSLS